MLFSKVGNGTHSTPSSHTLAISARPAATSGSCSVSIDGRREEDEGRRKEEREAEMKVPDVGD